MSIWKNVVQNKSLCILPSNTCCVDSPNDSIMEARNIPVASVSPVTGTTSYVWDDSGDVGLLTADADVVGVVLIDFLLR